MIKLHNFRWLLLFTIMAFCYGNSEAKFYFKDHFSAKNLVFKGQDTNGEFTSKDLSGRYSGFTRTKNSEIHLSGKDGEGFLMTWYRGQVNSIQLKLTQAPSSSNKILIYGQNTPWKNSADLYKEDLKPIGSITGVGSDTLFHFTEKYKYVGFRAEKAEDLCFDNMVVEWETKQFQSVTFNADTVKIAQGCVDAQFPKLTGTMHTKAIYESSNTKVATIDEVGKISLTGELGQTVIKGIMIETEEYEGDTASYVLMVVPAPETIKDRITVDSFKFRSEGRIEYVCYKSETADYESHMIKEGDMLQFNGRGGIGLISTRSDAKLVSVSFELAKPVTDKNQIKIHASNEPFKYTNDLYSSLNRTFLTYLDVKNGQLKYTFTKDFKYIGIRARYSGNISIKSITIEYEKPGKPVPPEKKDQWISFSKNIYDVESGTETIEEPRMNGQVFTQLTYESNNTKVATVDKNSGKVKLTGEIGTAKIIATAEETEEYKGATGYYTINVKQGPKTVKNIAEFLNKKDSKERYSITNPVTVIAQSGWNLWVKDETGYLRVNGDLNKDYAMGDVIPARFSGIYSNMWKVPTMEEPKNFKDAIQKGTEVLPEEMKIAELTQNDINKYIILKSVLVTKGDKKEGWLINGTDSIAYNDRINEETIAPADSNIYDVKGIVYYNKGIVIYPTEFTFVKKSKEEQQLSFAQTEYTVTKGSEFTTPELTGAHTELNYTTSNEEVAKVDAKTGTVTVGAIGDAVITVTAAADDHYYEATASYTIHVIARGESLPYRMDNRNNINQLGENFTVEGLDKRVYKWEDSRLKFDSSNDQLTMKLAEAPATLSYFIRMHGTLGNFGSFVVSTSVDGVEFKELKAYGNDDFTEGHTAFSEDHIALDKDVRYIRWTYAEKIQGNIGLGSILITKAGEKTGYTVNMNETQYATFFADEPVVLPEGLTAYYAFVAADTTNITEEYVPHMILPANTPVLLKGEQGQYELIKTNVPATVSDNPNLLRGTVDNATINASQDYKFYVLGNDKELGLGFYFQDKDNKGNQVSNLANQAYLAVPVTVSLDCGFPFEKKEETGIDNINMDKTSNTIYTFSGVRVNANLNKLPKGLYIINGKKFLVK